jgi:hypothetical protein
MKTRIAASVLSFLLTISFVILCLVTIAACHSTSYTSKPSSTPTQAVPVVTAAAKTDVAIAKVDSADDQRVAAMITVAGKVKANVAEANDANNGNPDGAPKTVVAGETSLALTRLKDVPDDPVEAQAAKDRRALVETGKTQQAQAAYTDANAKALQLSKDLGKAEADAAQARVERDKVRQDEKDANATYIKNAEAAKTAHEAEIAKLNREHQAQLDELKSAEARKQALYLRLGAGLCLLVLGVGVGFGQFEGLKRTWVFGLFALVLFGLAQLVTQPWFMYAVLVGTIVVMIAVGFWLWQHQKKGDLAVAVQQKATQLGNVTTAVVPVLDNAYNDAEPETKKWLDEHVFSVLSSKMDAADKSIVHTIRADIAKTAT